MAIQGRNQYKVIGSYYLAAAGFYAERDSDILDRVHGSDYRGADSRSLFNSEKRAMRIENRDSRILKLVKGKDVLDIGCTWVDDDGTWVHGDMARVAKSITGIDIVDVEKFRLAGWDIIQQSADKPFDLRRQFDVITAIEVLDHTANLGIFMQNAKQHLKPDGIFVVAMHNPQAFEFFLEQFFFKGSLKIYQHTHWQNETTMKNLLERYGMKLKYREFYHYGAFSTIGKVYDVLTWPLPSIFSRCVLYVAVHNA